MLNVIIRNLSFFGFPHPRFGVLQGSNCVPNDPITEQLAQLAKILGPTAPIPEPFPGPKSAAAATATASSSPTTPQPQKAAAIDRGAAGPKDGPDDADGESSAGRRGPRQLHHAGDGAAADGSGVDGADTGSAAAAACTGGIGIAGRDSPAASTKIRDMIHETSPVSATKTSPSTAAAKAPLSSRQVLAPTNTISQNDDANDGRDGSPPPSQKRASSRATAAAAAVPPTTEREPEYRIEQLPSLPPKLEDAGENSGGVGSGDVGGCGGRQDSHQKRSFVVIIDLPDLIEGVTDGETRELAGSEQEGAGDGSSRTAEGVGGSSSSSRGIHSRVESGGGKRKGRQTSISDVELDVFPTVLQLKVPGKYQLRLDMPCVVDEESVTAKFNKSRAVLKVSVLEK